MIEIETTINRNLCFCTNKKITIESFLASLIVAITPIISPYVLFNFSYFWILGLLLIALLLLGNNINVRIDGETKYLVAFALISFFLSFNGLSLGYSITSLIFSMLSLLFDLIIYLVAWRYVNFKLLVKLLDAFAYICCGVLFLQLLLQYAGIQAFDGKIPFLSISDNQGWIESSYGYRFNSLFSEPSYFAIFLLPIFTINFLHNKWLNSFVFGISIILSSSSIGIILLAVVFLYKVIVHDIIKEKRIKFAIASLICFFAIVLLIINVPFFTKLWLRSFNKVSNINDGNSDLRLIGYLELFNYYPLKEKLFGTGVAQLKNYFASIGINIYNYSGSVTLTLLHFGIIGLIAFFVFAITLFKHSISNNSLLFFVLFLSIFAIDSLIFNYRFYYLLFFTLFYYKIDEVIR